MAELADAQDLGSCAAKRAGSSPVTRTILCGHLGEQGGLRNTPDKSGVFLYFFSNILVRKALDRSKLHQYFEETTSGLHFSDFRLMLLFSRENLCFQKVVQPHRCTTFIFPIHKDAYRQEKSAAAVGIHNSDCLRRFICNVLW